MNETPQRQDAELFRALISGDRQAIAIIADRHAQGIYDFVLRSTMDEQQAVAVTETTFERLGTSREIPAQTDFRTWLYSLALVEVLGLVNERRPARVSVEDRRFLRSDGDYDAEMLLWAWQAARGLRTRDYCVLDLTLRRKMTPEDLADSASLTRSNLYASIGRARGAFEETFGATVLFMRGRHTCPELDAMVSAASAGTVRPALRHQIADHADGCDSCRRTMAALPLASEVYVSLMDVDVPPELQARLAGAPPAVPAPPARPADVAALGAGAIAEETFVAPADIPEATEDGGELLPAFQPVARTSRPTRTAATSVAEEAFFRPVDGQDYDRYAHFEPQTGALTDKLAPWMVSLRVAPFWAIAGVATVIAIYLAMAVGDSIQGGGGNAGAVPLQSTSSGGGGQAIGEVIECGSPFVALEHGTESVVSFEPNALDGFSIGGLAVTPNSSAATAQGLKATAEGNHSIKFQAAKAQSTANRTDEYLLRISWRKGSDVATSECPVTVRVSAAAP
jgi:DNA-directed RNA polymerase specialized sigma24 family protein